MTRVDVDSAALWTEHRAAVWGLCYRLTGSAADADDLTQETFRRALEQPPADLTKPWRPWLLRVATNLAVDQLRQRQSRAYVGPWLPSPIETAGDDAIAIEDPALSAEVRYGALESVSFAFLLALEGLEPKQRAVLVLRDVLGFSGPETAECLGLSVGNVRVILHRARDLLAAYDHTRSVPTPVHRERNRAALHRFLAALATGDLDAVSALLAKDVVVLQDGAGEVKAALLPVRGPEAVAKMHLGIRRMTGMPVWSAEREVNGMPAMLTELGPRPEGFARQIMLRLETDAAGQITAVHAVLARGKLGHLRWG